MARSKHDPKSESLREHGCLHPHPDRVTDEAFACEPFFDPRDLLQVKYEMLRRVRVEGDSVSQSASRFGLSRPSYYQALEAFEAGGLAALLPKKSGPRQAHKLTDEVVAMLREALSTDPELSNTELAMLVHTRFAVVVHPRSIDRVLARREKKR